MYKVLLVDDEYMILEGLKRIIPWEEWGFQVVHTAKRANDALDYLSHHPVDLLVTDVSMPEMTGIEMVEQIRKSDLHTEVLILSGYQEFEYVKQGMELGVKGYLLKPVDKKELEEKILSVKASLDTETKDASKEQLYNQMMLVRWLNDELSEGEYLDFMSNFTYKQDAIFSVIILSHEMETKEYLDFSLENQQYFVFTQENDSKYSTIILFYGSKIEMTEFVKKLWEFIEIVPCQVAIGEAVSEWENVYESFEQAKATSEFSIFYGENSKADHAAQLFGNMDQNLFEFMSFNKALMVGNLDEIIFSLKEIFSEMKQMHFPPENVRHVTFLLFTDIYRQYASLPKELYEETLLKISNSKNIQELEEWLLNNINVYHGMDDKPKRYSGIVQQALDIIDQDYQKDLALNNLSEKLHVNSVYLGQLFKKETNRSFAQMLNQTRIKKAQNLLIKTNQTIHDIAFETGYNNVTYFTKMFRKLNGVTPKEFRERYT